MTSTHALKLKNSGVYPTAQRLAIADMLFDRHQHFTADSLQEALIFNGIKVSKATVYNTLKLFVEKGLVNELVIDSQKCFYDTNTSHHHHFYNIDTGELTDIESITPKMLESLSIPEGTTIDNIDLVVRLRNH
ncbi:Fur family transcriptional regulator [Oceanospirillum sediminis]|uniref:Ferric uptake regulation protein n=1 Tax=Oceanospirillum sediminis TaxID=2760088 RepID=A0A839IX09_9GAMM|nr:Fur family transcriptional regulator [Oceanospirillum sediminis]MBB1488989.1 transcriptional repressor [Oceanospirillum sediminis]